MRLAWILPCLWMPVAMAQEATIADFKFSVRTLGGQQITQENFKDNVLIVDLWGTWCPPCRKAIPKLVELYAKHKHQGLEIVGFSYKADGSPEDAAAVRQFAVDNHITYSLAAGDPKVREQVPGFSGYPTLLLFQKGLKNEAIHVGYSDEEGRKLEEWLAKALGGPDAAEKPAEEKLTPEAEEAKRIKEEKVPKGKIFMPGNGDQGLDFEVEDARGERLKFSDLHGQIVLLALTTTWDREAERTTAFLKALQKEQPKLRVLAACLEQERDPDKKAAAVRAYRDRLAIEYTLFPASVKFAMDHFHSFAALPTLLVFDSSGTLVLRQNGISDEITAKVREQVGKLLQQ